MDPSSSPVTREQTAESEVSPGRTISILNLKDDFFKELDWTSGRVLGSGMSGDVVEAIFRGDSSVRCAVKVMPLRSDTISEATVRKLFRREMDVLRLDHSGLVQGVLAAECPNHLCIAMKLYPCGDLISCLPNIPGRAKPWIAGRITNAVTYLHSKRIMHGDIKPDNILIDHGFAPKLGDFGLARHFPEDQVSSRGFGGTPDYWAPEIRPPVSHGEFVDPFKVKAL